MNFPFLIKSRVFTCSELEHANHRFLQPKILDQDGHCISQLKLFSSFSNLLNNRQLTWILSFPLLYKMFSSICAYKACFTKLSFSVEAETIFKESLNDSFLHCIIFLISFLYCSCFSCRNWRSHTHILLRHQKVLVRQLTFLFEKNQRKSKYRGFSEGLWSLGTKKIQLFRA